MKHEFPVGDVTWSVAIPPEKRLELRGGIPAQPATSLHDLVRDALEKPYQFEALRRALTPDDRVAIVVDESLPKLAEAVVAVLEHLGTAGIAMEAVTLILRPESSHSGWIDELSDEFADVKTEVHDPADRKKLAYLAATKSERRIYLNRTLVESDFAIVIGGRKFDPEFGLAGAEELFFPLLSDAESIEAVRGTFRYKTPSPDPDATEVAMLFGSPFFVQVIDDGHRAVEVVTGLPNSLAEGVRRHDARWKLNVTEKPETVVASVSSNPRFPELATAALNAARIVAKGGRIVLLAPPMDVSGEGVAILRGVDDPGDARKVLAKVRPDDWTACHLWATAARRGRLYVANLDADFADELFANAIGNAREVERLLESSETILILPNAHRSIVEVDGGEKE